MASVIADTHFKRKVVELIEDLTHPTCERHQSYLDMMAIDGLITVNGSWKNSSLSLNEIVGDPTMCDHAQFVVAANLTEKRLTKIARKKNSKNKKPVFFRDEITEELETLSRRDGGLKATITKANGEERQGRGIYTDITLYYSLRCSSNKTTSKKYGVQIDKRPNFFVNDKLKTVHKNSGLAGQCSTASRAARGDGYYIEFDRTKWFQFNAHHIYNKDQEAPEPPPAHNNPFLESDCEDEDTSSNYSPSTTPDSTPDPSIWESDNEDEEDAPQPPPPRTNPVYGNRQYLPAPRRQVIVIPVQTHRSHRI